MRNFALERFFSKWEFKAKYHMTASDIKCITIGELLAMEGDHAIEEFKNLPLSYTETYGNPKLRELIAETYVNLKAEHILCMCGAGEGLYAVARVLLSKDDHVIVPVPNYQSAETVPLEVCEVTGVLMDYDSNTGWSLDMKKLKEATKPNTKLISLNFPHNPTGYVLDKTQQLELLEWCREKDIYLFFDEVYRGVELEDEDQLPQVADVYEKGISLNVMSKAYGLPGLRLGWLASQDKEILHKIECYKHYLSICNAAPSEYLAVLALKHRKTIIESNKALLRVNLEHLENLFADFRELFEWHRPRGSCVAFPKYLGADGVEEFCKKLLHESGVLLLPASIYHSDVAEVSLSHFRIGFGRADCVEGVNAMRAHLEKHYR